jgi:hypothetical protein
MIRDTMLDYGKQLFYVSAFCTAHPRQGFTMTETFQHDVERAFIL